MSQQKSPRQRQRRFGDVEFIVVMLEVDGHGSIKLNCIGLVDNENVKTSVVNRL